MGRHQINVRNNSGIIGYYISNRKKILQRIQIHKFMSKMKSLSLLFLSFLICGLDPYLQQQN